MGSDPRRRPLYRGCGSLHPRIEIPLGKQHWGAKQVIGNHSRHNILRLSLTDPREQPLKVVGKIVYRYYLIHLIKCTVIEPVDWKSLCGDIICSTKFVESRLYRWSWNLMRRKFVKVYKTLEVWWIIKGSCLKQRRSMAYLIHKTYQNWHSI